VPEYPLYDLAAQRPDLGHYVYRFHDSEGALLYIGSTGNLWYRIGQHAAEREWWPEVSWARTFIELVSGTPCSGRGCHLPEHAEMLRYEGILIKDLQPRRNSLMTGYCRSGRHLLAEVGKLDGRGNVRCGECNAERNRRYYQTNREERLAYANAYYQANRAKVLGRNKQPGVRARMNAYKRTPEWRAKARAYEAKPEVRARRRVLDAARRARRKASEGET
jgi:hypothetical protein